MSASVSTLDPRILKIVIQIADEQYTFEDDGKNSVAIDMRAKGTKYANAIKNECDVTIANLDTNTKNLIVTETSVFNKNNVTKNVSIYAGRVSKGYSLVYTGDFTFVNVTQPPDVKLSFKTATAYSKTGLIGVNRGSRVSLSNVSQQVADSLGLSLNFSATDKIVNNYAFSGSQLKEVDKLGDLAPVNAYVDDNTLVVKNINLPLPNAKTIVNINTGLIGVPEVNEQGVKVKFLFDNETKLGGEVELTSILNPALNGNYIIYKLEFDLTNRDTQFQYEASCLNPKFAVSPDDDSEAVNTDDDDDDDDDDSEAVNTDE
jgi:hypothetical protein